MNTHMSQSCDGMVVLRAFDREETTLKHTIKLINEANMTDKISSAANEYYHRRMDWISKILYVFVGMSCIQLKGSLSPIYLAMIF